MSEIFYIYRHFKTDAAQRKSMFACVLCASTKQKRLLVGILKGDGRTLTQITQIQVYTNENLSLIQLNPQL